MCLAVTLPVRRGRYLMYPIRLQLTIPIPQHHLQGAIMTMMDGTSTKPVWCFGVRPGGVFRCVDSLVNFHMVNQGSTLIRVTVERMTDDCGQCGRPIMTCTCDFGV